MDFAARAVRNTLLCRLACAAALLTACSDDNIGPIANAAGSAGAGGMSAGGAAGLGGATAAGAGGGTPVAGAGGGTPVVPFTAVTLFDFNAGVPGSYGWAADPNLGTVSVVDDDRDPASTTRGALRFNAVFPNYDTLGASTTVSVLYTFGDPNTGTNKMLTGGSRVHFWIRLVSPTGSAPSLGFFQPFIQGGAATGYANNYGYFAATTITDNAWHPFDLEVGGQAFMSDVWRVGVQLGPLAAPPANADAGAPADAGTGADAGADAGDAGASSAPAPVTIDIDYVWIE
jgi:hypothetical protein